jgi:1-acyl-sn-glycerol-3-phosphate acyltransferase
MIKLRSAFFFLFFWIWSAVMNIAFLPMLAFHKIWIVRGQTVWTRGTVFLLHYICGLELEIRGRENMPSGAGLIACKHQSAFETMIFHMITKDPAMIMKKELLKIPIYGWYCKKTEMITVDRKGQTAALKAMIAQSKTALEENRSIIIFPEGTRSGVDESLDYQPGIAALYSQLNVPVHPVALNTGLFWPRKSFLCRPGRMIIEFLPPIDAGMKRREFMAELRERIESKSRELVEQGRKEYIKG